MDQALSSLFPVHQIGADAFQWWIGQVESPKDPTKEGGDPKKAGRYRVRIVGIHLKDTVPTNELPWAQPMMPLTHPFSDTGETGSTVNLDIGNWVIGFFLDSDKQKPIIMGSIGHVPGSTVNIGEPNSGEYTDDGLGFTKIRTPSNPQQTAQVGQESGVNQDGLNAQGGPPAAALSHELPTAVVAAIRSSYSEVNPIGTKMCVEVANPKCGSSSNFSKRVTNIIADLLAANQKSGGQLGSYYVSKVNGFLYGKKNIARYHIGRVNRLVRALMGRAQSEMIKNIRKGIEDMINSVLGLNKADEEKEKTEKDPEQGHTKVKKKGNFLKRVKQALDRILSSVGCSIEGAIDRLVKWITNLLFDFIMDVISPAVCFITTLVQGILNQVMSVLNGVISAVMGPLQSILNAIGGSINIVSSALNKIMSFLGITCTGPEGKCPTKTKVCTDCGEDDEEDFLDQLIDDLESGDTGERFVCDDAKDFAPDAPTRVVFVGGVHTTPPPSPPTTPPGSDDPNNPTPDDFFPTDGDPTDDDTDPDPEDIDIDDIVFDDDPTEDDLDPDIPVIPGGDPYYEVTADNDYVYNGETITYTIRTSNVPLTDDSGNPTPLKYVLSGSTIGAGYFVSDDPNPLEGDVTLSVDRIITEESVDDDGNEINIEIPWGVATVTMQLADNVQLPTGAQDLLFTVHTVDPNGDSNNDSVATEDVRIGYDLSDILFPDTDYTDENTPTYSVAADKEVYEEGEDITFTITTTNVEDGTRLEHMIYGDIELSDLLVQSMTGTSTIVNNTAKFVVGIAEDIIDEFDENLYFALTGLDAQVGVVIKGTAEQDTTDPEPPGVDKPTAGPIITDPDGTIIEIPISDPGDTYLEAPTVVITGEGFGATGIALLDPSGYVSEIRVTRGGLGYKLGLPGEKKCIIDSFTLISPGIRYTSAPKVYINGYSDRAEAEIDHRGYVVSVKILDRETTYVRRPSVKIVGGGGSGAVALASMVCLGPDDLATRGAVKIGTGKYIDCP